MRFGYYVDLGTITLSDDNKSWVHAMPIGEYTHPVYGKLSFTADRVQKFAESVAKRVRGIDLDIDYDHKARTSEAAGWVKAAEARSNGLWLLVEWTKAAAEKIRDKAYRYFSPEFLDKWTDAKNNVHTDVLCGGGITNRPFLKGDLVPVNLSEIGAVSFTEKEKELDGKKLRQELGLPEDATDDQVMQKVADLKSAAPQPAPGSTHPVTGEALPANTNLDPRNSQPRGVPSVDASVDHNTNPFLSEAALKQLSEANPAVKALMDGYAAQQKQLAEVQHSLKLSEVTRRVGSFNTAQQVIAPAAAELIRDVMMLSDGAATEKIEQLLKLLSEDKVVVKLGETSAANNPGSRGAVQTPEQELEAAIQKVVTERKLSYADAYGVVLSEQPDLGTKYLEAMR